MDCYVKFLEWYASAPHDNEEVAPTAIYPFYCKEVDIMGNSGELGCYREVALAFSRTALAHRTSFADVPGSWIPKPALEEAASHLQAAKTFFKNSAQRAPPGCVLVLKKVTYISLPFAFASYCILLGQTEDTLETMKSLSQGGSVMCDDADYDVEMEIDLQEEEQECRSFGIDALALGEAEEEDDSEGDEDEEEDEDEKKLSDITPILVEGKEYLLLSDVLRNPSLLRMCAREDELISTLAEWVNLGLDFVDDLDKEMFEVSSYTGNAIKLKEAYERLESRYAQEEANLPTEEEFQRLRAKLPTGSTGLAGPSVNRGSISLMDEEKCEEDNLEGSYLWEVDDFSCRHARGGQERLKDSTLLRYISRFVNGEVIVFSRTFSPKGGVFVYYIRALCMFGNHSQLTSNTERVIAIRRDAVLQYFDDQASLRASNMLNFLAAGLNHPRLEAGVDNMGVIALLDQCGRGLKEHEIEDKA